MYSTINTLYSSSWKPVFRPVLRCWIAHFILKPLVMQELETLRNVNRIISARIAYGFVLSASSKPHQCATLHNIHICSYTHTHISTYTADNIFTYIYANICPCSMHKRSVNVCLSPSMWSISKEDMNKPVI